MVRKYIPKRKNPAVSKDKIDEAIRKVKEEGQSIRSAAREIGIDESSLRGKIKNKPRGPPGGRTSLPHESERELALVLSMKAKCGFSSTREEVRSLVAKYVECNINSNTEVGNYLRKHCRFKVCTLHFEHLQSLLVY